ncbi:succinyl-diaminopimelate desuccinylase [Govanella unica]|uniref:Succinyl-diaminopimelate desuccinylase n=1 Tax=Govanella unica TaxID=2975056 RepID=A0A9X3TVU9_9PROT|nr:succinyl-diaminopimelate desuccinylase [Govania unica]MDA5192950.1 succinyl-diaminopimelate desuccinylase [Govania unica]
MLDPVALAQSLIRCPSVTPAEAGALDLLQRELEGLGFTCHRLPFDGDGTERVDNLYARIGSTAPHFCFAGHTDVVPVGDAAHWTVDPFAGTIENGTLYGRGANDMKGAIAAFVAAAADYLKDRELQGSISLLITGDEEGVAINGTRKMLDWLKARGEVLDACVVGEPTNPRLFGEMIKIGRRGSLNAEITVIGAQGHVAYPHLSDNPIPRMLKILTALNERKLDDGTDHFDPSNLEVVSIDVGNTAANIIPAAVTARLNIRFNDRHTGASLIDWLREVCEMSGGAYELRPHISGESFLTAPGHLSDLVIHAVHDVTGVMPELSTTGGTSDARFIKDACPVLDFGLVGATMHKVDERASVADIQALTKVYRLVLERFFVK